MREQIISNSAWVEHPVLRLFANAGRATEFSLNTKMISVIQAVVDRALVKHFPSDAFYSVLEEAVQKRVEDRTTVGGDAARLVDALSFTVSADKFVKN